MRTLKLESVGSSQIPVEAVRGMTQLDRSKFATTAHVCVLQLPVCDVENVLRKVKKVMVQLRNVKSIQEADEQTLKEILLDPALVDEELEREVYWNPRLANLHKAVLAACNAGDTLCDVFAGVGPFACPAGKKRVRVFANDLNPACYEYLQENIRRNKVSEFVTPYNMDGREFIRSVVLSQILLFQEPIPDGGSTIRKLHVTMNLPVLAIDFLDAFQDLLKDSWTGGEFQAPRMHVYCFVRDTEPNPSPLERVRRALGCDETVLPDASVKETFVRKVAPGKEMRKLVFDLPLQPLLQARTISEELRQPSEELRQPSEELRQEIEDDLKKEKGGELSQTQEELSSQERVNSESDQKDECSSPPAKRSKQILSEVGTV
ncbi:unnamed protein product [Cyprideis torosa]|uniref:SAM-dependent methyltransferase TRM5/TYW2-type domain-containing protein n=1 Tax=Cyprideis torosa TaxID=163714 RepID=A0A7R8ZQU7_9CRUS|nr:unnamed protein product [Cyprideis torosa]CAG0902234.1 unnamed protein product [Cyprideis torosa]